MTEKRFIITQNGDNFTVRDAVKKRHMGMFEFKEDEFPVYFCFHKIIDLLNELSEENKNLEEDVVDLTNALFSTKEENEQLRTKNNAYIQDIEVFKEENTHLKLENEQLKEQFKRCRDWINSDKNDYELTLAFIKSKGYSLRDVLEYEKMMNE